MAQAMTALDTGKLEEMLRSNYFNHKMREAVECVAKHFGMSAYGAYVSLSHDGVPLITRLAYQAIPANAQTRKYVENIVLKAHDRASDLSLEKEDGWCVRVTMALEKRYDAARLIGEEALGRIAAYLLGITCEDEMAKVANNLVSKIMRHLALIPEQQ